MKKLGIDEIFLLSAMADKMQIKIEIPKKKDIPEDDFKRFQKEYGIKLALDIFSKIHKAKEETTELIKSIIGKDPKEMNLIELKDAFMEIFQREGIVDFFVSAASMDTKE